MKVCSINVLATKKPLPAMPVNRIRRNVHSHTRGLVVFRSWKLELRLAITVSLVLLILEHTGEDEQQLENTINQLLAIG